ncbi:hypothetical protein NDU88_004318 [Pleurodeles waltl]|uniref:Uncharacterized protein n=1 Tax=Pleurodeles waltl TaxID=8319 RepID=A0AAV7QC86_PLEWA|nr:hypothetical protein NDU88_004318 [Pleurodeles waltl]
MEAHTKHLDDQERQARRNNFHFVGLPEHDEGYSLLAFLELWLQVFIALEGLTNFYAVENAHRVPAREPHPRAPACPLVARLLLFQGLDHLLQRDSAHSLFVVNNVKVSLHPDCTLQVQTQQAFFIKVKQKVCDIGLLYFLIFPTRLRIQSEDTVNFLKEPSVASD